MSFITATSYGQSVGQIFGTVSDEKGKPIPFANIIVKGTSLGSSANEQGKYKLIVSLKDSIIIEVSSIGYTTESFPVSIIAGESMLLNITLKVSHSDLEEVSVLAYQRRFGNIERIDHRDIEFIPDVSGSFESLLKSLPGVSSSNELSSQYSVRGGNFDENLVYVNDIEVYRPFLIRSGQQEGLSFINSDMVEGVEFSAGGFNAEYGDKMSSVLSIRYRQPYKNSARAEFSLLGASALAEGISKNEKFTHITGVRYKTSQYLLKTLDVRGDYKPSFFDIQSNLSYRFSNSFSISILGNYSFNNYLFVPEVRETRFGTFNNALQLKVYYDGQEVNRFETMQGAVTADFRPSEELSLKFITGAYLAREAETFDVLGQYLLNELDNNLGSTAYGDSILNVGIGGFLNHARNYLDAEFYRFEHLGSHITETNKIKWGVRYQLESISDKINEWELIDSSGYAVPYNGNDLILNYWLRSSNTLVSNRISGFVQESFTFDIGNSDLTVTAGTRSTYWSYNKQWNFSPRASIILKPDWENNFAFHLSGGYYHQPPMYKEFRLPSGSLNPEIRSQESIHFVLGSEYHFMAWHRPFRFQAEIYHKLLNNIIPYKVDNVRIKYSGENIAKGYAQGIDLKVNGEFVDGAESWASLSVMRSYEDILNDFYIDNQGNRIEPGYYPRPTDQRFNVGIFFQDYIIGQPTFRVHLSGHYGTGLPFGIPKSPRYDLFDRMPSYKRIDIGFSKVFKDDRGKGGSTLNHVKWLKSFWVSAEVFNLFDFNNTISYLWVQTVGNQENQPGLYAVPNYLTSRRLNIKIAAKF